MKIQEMKSGRSHLSRKTPMMSRDNVFKIRPVTEALAELELPAEETSEMEEALWSVVSFQQREAGGLTFRQAIEILSELDALDVAGLCIVTDEAAKRMRPA